MERPESEERIDEVEVVLRGAGLRGADAFDLGGRRGNVVTYSSTPEILKGWRLLEVNGRVVGEDKAALAALLREARREARYTAKFRTALKVSVPPSPAGRPETTRARRFGSKSLIPGSPTPRGAASTCRPGSSIAAAGRCFSHISESPIFDGEKDGNAGPEAVVRRRRQSALAVLREQSSLELSTGDGVEAAAATPAQASDAGAKDSADAQPARVPSSTALLRASSLQRACSNPQASRSPWDVYEEERKLGSGGFGAAFLIRRLDTGRRFVAKKVRVEGMDARQRQACLDEISLLRRLSHSCIATYVDFLWEDDERQVFWLVLKHYPGGDVQHQVEKSRSRGERLLPRKTRNWLTQLCLALAHVHALCIVHCDVKGSNLFITLAENIVLGDFGVSKQLLRDELEAETSAGSPCYMSPERWCDGGKASYASDMWSVGVVAYELTSLRQPFQAHTLLSLIYKVSAEEPEPLTDDDCDSDLQGLVIQLFKKRPEDRPTAKEALQCPSLSGCLEVLADWRFQLEELADELGRMQDLSRTLGRDTDMLRKALKSSGSRAAERTGEEQSPALCERNSTEDTRSTSTLPHPMGESSAGHGRWACSSSWGDAVVLSAKHFVTSTDVAPEPIKK